MIIQSYENSKRADACIEYIRGSEHFKKINAIYLLPIPSTRDNVTITGTNIDILGVIEQISCGDLLVGYGLPKGCFCDEGLGGGFFDVEDDEDFLLENAYLTALATIGIIMTSETRAPSDMRIGVVGYGRIGKYLTEMLLYLGAYVRVYTSRRDTRIDLCESGVMAVSSCENADLRGIDLLINTAPAVIFDTSAEGFPQNLRIIDLASGVNFPDVKRVEKYPSIPAKMFPVTAGIAWGRAIERYVISKMEHK